MYISVNNIFDSNNIFGPKLGSISLTKVVLGEILLI